VAFDAKIPTPTLRNSNGVERSHSLATEYRRTEPLEGRPIVRHLDGIHYGRLIDIDCLRRCSLIFSLISKSVSLIFRFSNQEGYGFRFRSQNFSDRDTAIRAFANR
jgi:hypothetical protein